MKPRSAGSMAGEPPASTAVRKSASTVERLSQESAMSPSFWRVVSDSSRLVKVR